MTHEREPSSLRVLVLAPIGRDASLTLEVLGAAGIEAEAYPTAARLAEAISRGAGAVLVAEEALGNADAAEILEALDEQPHWSALPVLVMSSDEQGPERLVDTISARANITVLQRPARIAVLVSAVRAAVRWRERQYETRDLLERLREADRQKDEFLATISHELRTPLNAIVGWTAIMKAERCEVSSHTRGLEVLERSGTAQKRIIEDVLDVSNIIMGKLRLKLRRIDLVEAVAAAVESVRPVASARRVSLETSFPGRPTWVRGDTDRLQQVAWNLLSNAVKFTPEGGRVRVEVEHEDGSTHLRVSDTGQGIAPEFMPYVFERFRQADGSTTRRFGGLGLGLAIVRHIAELHGGSVRGESAGEGHGATFVVTLPEDASAADADAAYAENAVADEAPFAGVPSLEGVRLLVVDDNAEAVEMMRTMMGRLGADVRGVTSADRALAELVEWRPHVLVSDIAMPDHDGYWLIGRVRGLAPEEGAHTPAVALTALAENGERARAMLAGFQKYLRKPVSLGELAAAVAALAGVSPPPAYGE